MSIPSVEIPEGVSGNFRIERFTVSEEQSKFDCIRNMGRRFVPPGKYTRLIANGGVMMSDTPDEKRDHYTAVRMAKGDCLVMGLGLGMVANAMAQKEEVTSVTVIEISPDVIALVAPSLHEKVTVIEADALTWTPPKGQRYGCVWHDIWQHICADDMAERTKLKRRFGRRADWQGDWAGELCRMQRDQWRRQEREWRLWRVA